ncbi:MAG: hypothetical protein WCG95_00885 [bacterium]
MLSKVGPSFGNNATLVQKASKGVAARAKTKFDSVPQKVVKQEPKKPKGGFTMKYLREIFPYESDSLIRSLRIGL